jgi:hypothetical protein
VEALDLEPAQYVGARLSGLEGLLAALGRTADAAAMTRRRLQLLLEGDEPGVISTLSRTEAWCATSAVDLRRRIAWVAEGETALAMTAPPLVASPLGCDLAPFEAPNPRIGAAAMMGGGDPIVKDPAINVPGGIGGDPLVTPIGDGGLSIAVMAPVGAVVGAPAINVPAACRDTAVYDVVEGYAPERKLPKAPLTGSRLPDVPDPHTQLGIRVDKQGNPLYRQAREWGPDGQWTREIDFTDHGHPDVHTSPHQHPRKVTGGRGNPEPLP